MDQEEVRSACCPILAFVVLKLIAMLLQHDADQLTARPNAGVREQLLKCGFNRALRHSDSCRDLFIRKPLERKKSPAVPVP
jgi:hypothetical protein